MEIIRTELISAEDAILAAADRARIGNSAMLLVTEGCPSRTYLVVPKSHRVKLGGFRAVQPKLLARERDGIKVYRIPLPRKGTVAGTGRQQLIAGNQHQSQINWKEQGVDWKNAGHTETWSARRINQLESAVGAGSAAWRDLAEKYSRDSESKYDPKTTVLIKHAETLFAVLARIARDPKRRLGRDHRIVPVEMATEIDTESYAWLIRQSGTTADEKAHRGVLCSVRTTEYDTLENRVVRDFAQRTMSEVRRTERPHQDLKDWARKCSKVDQCLANLKVGEIGGHVQPNQVLRMNPDYRRVWEARKELLNQAEQVELLWCWQGETWNELALCLFKAAMAGCSVNRGPENSEAGWRSIIHSPTSMRRGQRQGRWIETDQQTAGIWVNLHRRRVLRLLGGGMGSKGSPTVSACRAIIYEMSRDNKRIAEMDVYAIPPIDVPHEVSGQKTPMVKQQSAHGRILVVSGLLREARDLQPEKSLTDAMEAIQFGLEKMEQR